METVPITQRGNSIWGMATVRKMLGLGFLLIGFAGAGVAEAADLKVMKMGLGSGTVTSPSGIDCGADCDESYGSDVTVTLTATPDAGSTFVRWDGDPHADPATTPDCSGTSNTCTLSMNVDRSVRPVFELSTPIPTLTDFGPSGIQTYLTSNPQVDSVPKFIRALPDEYKENWILMSRSESLQTGTAEMPRVLMPGADSRFVFSLGLSEHSSYPGAHPNAIEYMQWDAADKNFRFHEIVLDAIPALDADGDGIGAFPPRSRGITIDDEKCSKCHSTRNVLNTTTSPATDGVTPGTIQVKNKPNWDTYDSWGGMLPFNRDRIYQGSVEAAAFREIFNPWSWRGNDFVRSIIEQLALQPDTLPSSHAHVITRTAGGVNDGHVNFGFDVSPPVLNEPAPEGDTPAITTNYSFDGTATGTATTLERGGDFITLHHSSIPTSDEGRAVRFFDNLGGLANNLNQQRVADEVANHRWATGSVPIDVRPMALAIAKGCLTVEATGDTVTSMPAHGIDLAFFTARNGGMSINDVVADTQARMESIPLRKADIQKYNLDRDDDVYLIGTEDGLIQEYGAATSAGTDTSLSRIRQEIFRRDTSGFAGDNTVMGGIYVDREQYGYNVNRVALFRYFLEPLGVSVDKWSMGVRGRSRTYTFADVFSTYVPSMFVPEWEASLTSDPVAGLSAPYDCDDLIPAVNSTLSSLPPADDIPTYTDVQRIFNKSCIECHGGLDYPPYANYDFSNLDLSEDPDLSTGTRLGRSYANAMMFVTADPATSFLYQRITDYGSLPHPYDPAATNESCPFGVMPCGGPPLSRVDIETIRRWIEGGAPDTVGDPHIKTVNGINYDFQAAGEFILLRDPGLEIQARQAAVETQAPLGPNAHTGLTSCVSLNNAVALRIGRDRITYQPNLSGDPDPDGLQLRVNGELGQLRPTGINLESGGRIIQTGVEGGIQIEAPGGTSVVITPAWWSAYEIWYMNIKVRNARATQGIMGAIPPRNWLPALPDGTLLGPRPKSLEERYAELYKTFGNAWRVNDETSLFDYAPGTSTQNFTIESWPRGESPQSCELPPQVFGGRPTTPIEPLPLEVAQGHCADITTDDLRDNCIEDVMVTGHSGFAQTYLAAERIELNSKPSAPVLVSPDPLAVDVTLPVTFNWEKSEDADKDQVTYRYCIWPASKTMSFDDCEVVATQAGESFADIPVSWWWVLLVGLLVLLIVALIRKRIRLAILLALLVAIVLIITLFFARKDESPAPLEKTLSDLESGKTYYWKVIVEDDRAGTTESEVRRFTVK